MNQFSQEDPRALAQRRLEEMVGRGELTLAEFSDRAERIWAAATPAELDAALVGLPTASVSPVPRASSPITVVSGDKRTSVFGTLKREGRWSLPDGYRLSSWLGEIYLDARDAVVERAHTRMHIDAYGATVRILLPAGVTVTVSGALTLTDIEVDEGRYAVEGGPHIDVEMNAFMATVKVKVLESGEKIPLAWKWF